MNNENNRHKKKLPKVSNVCGKMYTEQNGITTYTAKCKECSETMYNEWDRWMDDMCKVCQMYLP